MPKQNGQHGTARAPKQRARKCASCTHSGVNRTRKGYKKQCLDAFGAIPASERIQLSDAGSSEMALSHRSRTPCSNPLKPDLDDTRFAGCVPDCGPTPGLSGKQQVLNPRQSSVPASTHKTDPEERAHVRGVCCLCLSWDSSDAVRKSQGTPNP